MSDKNILQRNNSNWSVEEEFIKISVLIKYIMTTIIDLFHMYQIDISISDTYLVSFKIKNLDFVSPNVINEIKYHMMRFSTEFKMEKT